MRLTAKRIKYINQIVVADADVKKNKKFQKFSSTESLKIRSSKAPLFENGVQYPAWTALTTLRFTTFSQV